MTNFERIKPMTLDELADFLETFNDCTASPDLTCCRCPYVLLCHHDITVADWLAREEEVKP